MVERCYGHLRLLGVGTLEGSLYQLDALGDASVDPINFGEDVA
jgi:hypothetical protein